MRVELKVASVGESITEVQIGPWTKREGEWIKKDEVLVEIESEKATVEMTAPVSGTLAKVLKKQGEPAAVGEVIGYIDESPAPTGDSKPTGESKPPAASESAHPEPSSETSAPSPKERAPAPTSEPRVMPAAQRLLAQEGLRSDEVRATGPGGRTLKEDVERHVADRRTSEPLEKTRPSGARDELVPAHDPVMPVPIQLPVSAVRQEETVPMSMIRRRIAQRLVEAQQTAALLTTFNDVDMSAVMALRQKHRDAFQARYGIKLGFMSFFVKAAIDALKQIPAVNAEIRGNNIVYRNYFDIGIAVAGKKGLVVPVLRDAERMSFAEVEVAIAQLSDRARENKLSIDELEGGTFTISNGGIYGSLLSTPIVNPPQSGILGMHAIQDRPVAINGQVVIRPMMYVALTYDHRIIDGREAVTFLRRIKDAVEEPSRMLLEI